MRVRKVITLYTNLCKIFHASYAVVLTSATDTVQVVDIIEDEEEEVMACADTEEGRL